MKRATAPARASRPTAATSCGDGSRPLLLTPPPVAPCARPTRIGGVGDRRTGPVAPLPQAWAGCRGCGRGRGPASAGERARQPGVVPRLEVGPAHAERGLDRALPVARLV